MRKTINAVCEIFGILAVLAGFAAFVWLIAAADAGTNSAEYDWAAEQTATYELKQGNL